MKNNKTQLEDLRKWFGKGKKGDWVRVGTDGEIKGQCAREPDEGKPKCMPRDKAHSMSKKDRASAARRKRRADPNPDRPGTGNKPIMVSTDKKKKNEMNEKNVPTNPKLWAKFKAQAKAKFDVYPSAYANGWAAKQYKAAGGGWKTESVQEMKTFSQMREPLQEKSVSQAQQKMMGMALAYKRGEMDDASPEVKKMANSMSMKDLEDFAKTKHKGLPVKKESVELDEAVNAKAIQKAVDDGKSMDVIMTMFANKRTTNTDEIRKVVKDYMWKKRMKKEEVELEEMDLSKQTSKQLLQFYRKYADKKMGPSDANTVRAVRRELIKRGVSIKEEVDLEEWKKDSGWKKAQKIYKDRYGNIIKKQNLAKHLAKKAQQKTSEMDK